MTFVPNQYSIIIGKPKETLMDILIDIDGLTVRELRKFLDSYNEDDVLEVRQETYRSFGTGSSYEQTELYIHEKKEK